MYIFNVSVNIKSFIISTFIRIIIFFPDFAEKLFKQLESTNERFEVKLMALDVISRLIGLHQLFLFNFYPYIQRFMQPHQRGNTHFYIFASIILPLLLSLIVQI